MPEGWCWFKSAILSLSAHLAPTDLLANSLHTLILLHTFPLYYEQIWAAVLRTKKKYVIQTSLSVIQTGALCITDAALCITDDSVCNTDGRVYVLRLLEFVCIAEKYSTYKELRVFVQTNTKHRTW